MEAEYNETEEFLYLDKINEDINKELNHLFSKAKEKNELNYIYLLLGCNLSKGISQPWEHPEYETFHMYERMKELSLEQEYKDMKIRLALLLYCHIYEANFIPRILYNLLTLIESGSYNEWPFPYNAKKKWEPSADRKLEQIKEKAREIDLNSFANLLDKIYDKKIRNAFFHSDYTFHSDGVLVSAERNVTTEIKTYEYINDLLNSMFIFFELFMEIWTKYKKSYPNGYKIKVPNTPLICTLQVDKKTKQIIGFTQELGNL